MNEMKQPIEELAVRLGRALKGRGWMATTAESCTGGGVAYAITEVSGSSAWFDRSFITYSNEAKQQMLGVSAATLAEHGAVSGPVVAEMVAGALAHSCAEVAVAISGIAGPDGGTPDKPVGTVWIGWGVRAGPAQAVCHHFAGDRQAVREQAVVSALRFGRCEQAGHFFPSWLAD